MKRPFIFVVITIMAFLLSSCLNSTASKKLYQQGRLAYQMQNYHSAFLALSRAANAGNVDAMYSVGYLYYYGLGVDRDPVEALKWFKKAASFGNVRAVNALKAISADAPKPVAGLS